MKKIVIGFCGGLVGAIISILFLLFAPNLEMEVYLSTGVTWLAIGILISICNLKINGAVKGITVSILVSISSLIYTISSSLSGAVWTLINTLIIGAIIGFAIDKVISKVKS